jgi:hypothetical protein
MALTMASSAPSIWRRGDQEVSLARLYVMRGICAFYVIANAFEVQRMLFDAPPTDRGMIKAFLSGLWVMAFIGIRYPLKMVPLFLFEFVWKTIWLFFFGLPQWRSGIGSPRLGQDMLEIGAFSIVFGLMIPWGYVWRHYVKQPAERWR